ncbi:MAG: ferrous iron transport protein A [Acidobacteria bacterium]|nr:ferrous iron transport protein A [Acidobacteriota bacterium]
MTKTLDRLTEGETGVIVGFDLPTDTQIRLMEMGFLEGHEVTLVRFAPLRDPLEVDVLNSRISIRRSEASGIRLRQFG